MTSPTPSPPAAPTLDDAHLLVERAVEALAELEGRPVAEHVTVLDGVHRSLQDALSALDEG